MGENTHKVGDTPQGLRSRLRTQLDVITCFGLNFNVLTRHSIHVS